MRPRLAKDGSEGGQGRLRAGEVVELAPEDALDGHVEHARGRRVEHADAAALVDGHGRRLHVKQDCAFELVYVSGPPRAHSVP